MREGDPSFIRLKLVRKDYLKIIGGEFIRDDSSY